MQREISPPKRFVQHFLAVSSFRGFLPKEESHFPGGSMHRLPHPTSLLKKSFAEQFSVGHMQRSRDPRCHGHTPLPAPISGKFPHHCRLYSYLTGAHFHRNDHLTPISVPSAFTGAQGRSIALLGACPGDAVAPRWLRQSPSSWRQSWDAAPHLQLHGQVAGDAKKWEPWPTLAPRHCVGSGTT